MACISIPTALAVAGAASAAGGIASASIGASAAKQAANTEAAAADKAIANQKDMFGQVEGILNPFISVGSSAIPTLQNLLGTGPNGPGGIQAALEATPGYQFTKQQGLQAAQSGFASQGLATSGPAIKGATAYAENLADTTYEQRLQDYLGTVGQGQQAASTLGGYGLNSASQVNQLITGKGQAQAAGTIGAANAITGGINNALGGISNAGIALGLNNAGMFGTPAVGPAAPSTPAVVSPSPLLNNVFYGGE